MPAHGRRLLKTKSHLPCATSHFSACHDKFKPHMRLKSCSDHIKNKWLVFLIQISFPGASPVLLWRLEVLLGQ